MLFQNMRLELINVISKAALKCLVYSLLKIIRSSSNKHIHSQILVDKNTYPWIHSDRSKYVLLYIHKWRIRRNCSQLFLNIDEMMNLENCHLATISVITDWGKNHKWMLKLVYYHLMSNKIFTYSPSVCPRHLLITKR